MNMRFNSLMAAFCACLLLLGCASNGKVVAANDKPALNGKVGTVKVSVDYDKIASERHEVIKKYEVVSRLQNGVMDQLKAQNKYESGGQVDLKIRLTGFRLRSGSSAFWLGAMAGKDFASVNVDVFDKGNKIHSYSTDSSTLLGGIIKPAPSQRINSVCKEVSKRIVSHL
jgi:outer membrane murein-binding lipoprotein Lpp